MTGAKEAAPESRGGGEPFQLIFDIGNTQMKMGIAARGALAATYVLPTERNCTGDLLGARIEQFIRHAGFAPEGARAALCCSVVPVLNPELAHACKRFFGVRLLFVPDDAPVPLKGLGDHAGAFGPDRLLGCYAARVLYPEPEYIICIDYGTATTFDCIRGFTYLGGTICPGVRSAADGLSLRASLLPKISLELEGGDIRRDTVLGRTTGSQLTYGFVYGFAGLTEGIVRHMREETSEDAFVVTTGGFDRMLAPVTAGVNAVRPDLLLEGGRLLLQKTPVPV